MEEWVGSKWHGFLTRRAEQSFTEATVTLDELKSSVGVIFRALGGDAGLRIEAAHAKAYFVHRTWLQKLAGHHQNYCVAWRTDESLHLPTSIALFPQASFNRELYIWLAMLAAQAPTHYTHWAWDNQQQVTKLLDAYPLFRQRYSNLVKAYLKLRPSPASLPAPEAALERAIQSALQKPGSVSYFPASNYAPEPVALWLYPSAQLAAIKATDGKLKSDQTAAIATKKQSKLKAKKQAERAREAAEKDGLMVFRLENIFSWSEYLALQRSPDDSDEDNLDTANDLDKITLSKNRDSTRASLKMDLDLPAQCNDDLPLGPGLYLPEWHWRKKQLQPHHVCLQTYLPKGCEPCALPIKHRRALNTLRSQFELLRSQRLWLRAQVQGEELDLNNWVEFYSERRAGYVPEPKLYQSYQNLNRDIACLLLADLSMSTDAHLDDDTTVIDVIRDALMLCAEALNTVKDPFAMYGFSSVKRQQVRYTLLKNFNERYNSKVRGRIMAIRPGFYTRMGAAIRQSSILLSKQAQSQRLMLILSDGKPNDIDNYEGRYGIEDTRMAVLEAKRQGVHPFCITVDQQADEYLPYLFGSDGFTVIQHPSQLPLRLPELYRQLTVR